MKSIDIIDYGVFKNPTIMLISFIGVPADWHRPDEYNVHKRLYRVYLGM